MTRKQQAFETLRQTIEELNLIADYQISVDSVIGKALKYTIAEIEMTIDYYKKCIQRQKADKFLQTPEGQRAAEYNRSLQEKIVKDQEELQDFTVQKINEALKNAGADMGVYHVHKLNDYYWTLTNSESKRPYYLIINIYFRQDNSSGTVNPSISVGSIGRVDAIQPSEGKSYYETVGKLFGIGELLKEVYNKFCGKGSAYEAKMTELKAKYNEINRWFDNPIKED